LGLTSEPAPAKKTNNKPAANRANGQYSGQYNNSQMLNVIQNQREAKGGQTNGTDKQNRYPEKVVSVVVGGFPTALPGILRSVVLPISAQDTDLVSM
jgi:hypothetical protein